MVNVSRGYQVPSDNISGVYSLLNALCKVFLGGTGMPLTNGALASCLQRNKIFLDGTDKLLQMAP
jgi:hypothetical protein